MAEPLIVLEGLRKTYNAGLPNEVEVLHGLALLSCRSRLKKIAEPLGLDKVHLAIEKGPAGEFASLRGTHT